MQCQVVPLPVPHRPVPGASTQARRGENTSNDAPVPSALPARMGAHLAPPSVLCAMALEVASHSRRAEPATMVRTSVPGKEPGWETA
jgi:hypothetical protein